MVEIKKEQTPEQAVQEHTQKAADETVTPDKEQKETEKEHIEEIAEDESAPEEEVLDKTDGEDKDKEAPEEEKKEGKKKKKPVKKDKRDEKIEELNDRLMRNLAEFENFRNRSEKEKSAMFDMGAKSVVEKILPVVDNLERGFDGLSQEEKETPFVKGIEAVYKQIQTMFEELEVKPIEAVGMEFDPNLHNAVMHDEDDSDETNKVTEEFQKGYMYKDSVVRHSMVKVLN